jgi:hypothetical protein
LSNQPIFTTNFTDTAELQRDWNIVSDDIQWGDYQSCRRPPGNCADFQRRLETEDAGG